jgi:hypothetical protein
LEARPLPVMYEAAPPARDAAPSARLSSLRRAAWLLLALAISAVAIVRLLDGIHVGDTRSAFRDADYVWLVPAVLFLVIDLQLRAVRWRLLRPLASRNEAPGDGSNLFVVARRSLGRGDEVDAHTDVGEAGFH